jgi:hypothetical protein
MIAPGMPDEALFGDGAGGKRGEHLVGNRRRFFRGMLARRHHDQERVIRQTQLAPKCRTISARDIPRVNHLADKFRSET